MKKIFSNGKLLTILGLGFSVVGMIVSSVASERKNEELLKKFVDEKLTNK